MIDLRLPTDPKLAAMVVHTRQLLLADASPRASALWEFGTTDGADAAHPGRIDYRDDATLSELSAWLVDHVRQNAHFDRLLGRDPVFLHVLAQAIEQAVSTQPLRKLLPIRIHGPTGSGKELLARAIHDASGVRGAFVPVHCAGITDDLLAAELFGHDEGAFTGAKRGGRDGLVAQAEGGTLFLDEVGDLPKRAQVTLLRFLQDQKYRRLGDHREKQADVRVICATWKDLEDLAARGFFRADLLYRLSGVRLHLPGLWQRRHELVEVAEAMVRRAGCRAPTALDDQARLIVEHSTWPGGFRQLDLELREAVRRADGGVVRARYLNPARTATFFGRGQAHRLAYHILAWDPTGNRAPEPNRIRARTEEALTALSDPALDEEEDGQLVVLSQVREAFDETAPPHLLLTDLLTTFDRQRALAAERDGLRELAELLPDAASELIQVRIGQVDTTLAETRAHLNGSIDELARRLPGLFHIFHVVQAFPGLTVDDKDRLFRAAATIIQFMMVLLPAFATHGVRRLAAHTLEELLVDEDVEHDPDNPFIEERPARDRSESDWRWLAETTSSLRDAEQVSGHSRNTVKVYFERHDLRPRGVDTQLLETGESEP